MIWQMYWRNWWKLWPSYSHDDDCWAIDSAKLTIHTFCFGPFQCRWYS